MAPSTMRRSAWVPESRSMVIIGEWRRYQPKTGIFSSSSLATMATSGNRRMKAIVSQVDW